MFGYMYGTCTVFSPTCSDQVKTNLPQLRNFDPTRSAAASFRAFETDVLRQTCLDKANTYVYIYIYIYTHVII